MHTIKALAIAFLTTNYLTKCCLSQNTLTLASYLNSLQTLTHESNLKKIRKPDVVTLLTTQGDHLLLSYLRMLKDSPSSSSLSICVCVCMNACNTPKGFCKLSWSSYSKILPLESHFWLGDLYHADFFSHLSCPHVFSTSIVCLSFSSSKINNNEGVSIAQHQ